MDMSTVFDTIRIYRSIVALKHETLIRSSYTQQEKDLLLVQDHILRKLEEDLQKKEAEYLNSMALDYNKPNYELPLPSGSILCTRCNKTIEAGDVHVGDGDGTGQRFAHFNCYYEKE